MFQIRDLTDKQFVVPSQFETYHFVADMIARIAGFTFLFVHRGLYNTVDNQNIPSKQGIGDFEEVFSFYTVHLEETVHSLGFTGDHACIRLERRFLGFRYGVGFRFVDSFRLTVFLFLLFKDVG